MKGPSTLREEQITAVVKAVYPLLDMGDLTITVTPGRVVIEQPEPPVQLAGPGGERLADVGTILGAAIGQAMVALTMVNSGKTNRPYFLSAEKACRKAMDALQELAASA